MEKSYITLGPEPKVMTHFCPYFKNVYNKLGNSIQPNPMFLE
jgi:hypothetical protein